MKTSFNLYFTFMPEIQMPKLSDTMTEGTLIAWKKKKGDQVSAGEVLAEIETDKATMEWESPEDGTLTEIYVQEGGKVNVGDKIAFIRGEGEEAPKQEAPAQKKEKTGSCKKKRSHKLKRKNLRRQRPQKKKPRRRSKKVQGRLCQPTELRRRNKSLRRENKNPKKPA